MRMDRRYGAYAAVALAMLLIFVCGSIEGGGAVSDSEQRQSTEYTPFPGFPVRLNTATVQDLLVLPGIGETTAARIVARRDELGGFSDITELVTVKRFGRARLERIRSLVIVEDRTH